MKPAAVEPMTAHLKRTRLLDARKTAGLTLRQLSARTGVPVTRLSDYERGLSQPLVPTAIRIARFYRRSVEELFADFIKR